MQEGDSTVLDNSIIYFTSEFGNGHEHDHRQLAMLVAGKAGGKLEERPARRLPAGPRPRAPAPTAWATRNDTQLAHLHLTTLHAFGINQPTFGQDDKGQPMATRTLAELPV